MLIQSLPELFIRHLNAQLSFRSTQMQVRLQLFQAMLILMGSGRALDIQFRVVSSSPRGSLDLSMYGGPIRYLWVRIRVVIRYLEGGFQQFVTLNSAI